MSKYNSFGNATQDCYLVPSFRVILQDAPTVKEIRQLFYDFYAQTRFNARYLFLEQEDYRLILEDFRNNYTRDFRWQSIRDFYDSPYSSLFRLPVPAESGMVYLSILPELDRGNVIIGFIK